ncbi:hypothetical protein ACLUWI_08705 [Limosilactobacillus mucosae]|uniref:hypothetical protein n=1 Tax=Limosilactobacillus mucosae TaxID=97478 RepID=UPI0039915C72
MIGQLVDKYGWGASTTTIYTALALAVCLLIYLLFEERHILRMEERANAEHK